MKPKDNETDIINWEAMHRRTKQEDAIIKKRMDEIWKRNYMKK